MAQGQWEDAHRFLERAITLAERGENLEQLRFAHSVLAERDLLEGRPQDATARLAPLLDRADRYELQVTPFLPLLAWAWLEHGQDQEARELLDQAIARAEAAELRPALVIAQRVQALLAMRQADWVRAQAALEAALALARAMHHPYAEAKTLYTAGLVAAAHGEREQSQRAMRDALAILHPLGERLYAARAEAALAPVTQH